MRDACEYKHTHLRTDKNFDGHLAETGQFMEETNFYEYFSFFVSRIKSKPWIFQILFMATYIHHQRSHILRRFRFQFPFIFCVFSLVASPYGQWPHSKSDKWQRYDILLGHLGVDRAQSKLWLFLFFGLCYLDGGWSVGQSVRRS